jgi:uncharacterized protein (DUF58 family)
VADGVVTALGKIAVRRAGRVALMTFGAGAPDVMPPRASKAGLVALRRGVEAGVAADGVADPQALAHALGRLGRIATQPGVVAIVSDFRDQEDWQRALGALRSRHTVIACEVRDPREGELPAAGRLTLVDPETSERLEVDTSHSAVRGRFAEIEAEGRARVAADLRRMAVEHIVLSTRGDWLRDLGRRLT